MKKFLAVITALSLILCFVSCKGKTVSHSSYEKIYNKYKDLKSYAANAEITVVSNLTENTYKVRQYFLAPSSCKMEISSPDELKGSGYSYHDGKIIMNSEFGKMSTVLDYIPEDRNYVFVSDFFENYYKSEDAFVETMNDFGTGECIVLKNVLSDSNPQRYSQSLWISSDDLTPVRLVTYDMEGKETLVVRFSEFKANCEIDDEIFSN